MLRNKNLFCTVFILLICINFISAQENRAPIFIATPAIPSTIIEGSSHTFRAQVSDPDGDPVSIGWYLDSVLVSTTDEYNFTAVSAGVYTLTIVISDGQLNNSIEFNIREAASSSSGGGGASRGGGGGGTTIPEISEPHFKITIITPQNSSTIKGDFTSLSVETNENAVCKYDLKKITSYAEKKLIDNANLGGVEGSALGSSIVLDSQDKWHITYYDGHTIKYIDNLSDEVIDIAQNADTHSLAIDSNDNLHLAYFVKGHSIMYTNNVDGTWSTPVEILSGINPSGYPSDTIGISLAIDSKNNWHIVYYDWYKIKYMNSYSSSPITLASGEVAGPDMTIDSDDKLHVAYYVENGDSHWSTDGYSVRYINNIGGDWSATQELTSFIPESYSSSDVSIAIDSKKNWHLVYRDDSVLYYINSKQKSPELLTTNGKRPRISVDSNDIAHIVYFSGINSVMYKKMDDFVTLLSKEMSVTGKDFHIEDLENLQDTINNETQEEKYNIQVTCTDESGNSAEVETTFYVDLTELREMMILEDIGDFTYTGSMYVDSSELAEDLLFENLSGIYYAFYEKTIPNNVLSSMVVVLEFKSEAEMINYLENYSFLENENSEALEGKIKLIKIDEGNYIIGFESEKINFYGWANENKLIFVYISPEKELSEEIPFPKDIIDSYMEKYPNDLGKLFINPLSDYGIDLDNDGLYDHMTIKVEVNAPADGIYEIHAKLNDVNGNEIDEIQEEYSLQEGKNIIEINFKGIEISKKKINGPFFLGNFEIENAGIIGIEHFVFRVNENIYTTQSYNYTNFDMITEDLTFPTIQIISPLDDYTTKSRNINFKYISNDNSDITSCELIIDGQMKETDTSIIKGSENNFDVTLSTGNYKWKIKCTDSYGNQGFSDERDLEIKKASSGEQSYSSSYEPPSQIKTEEPSLNESSNEILKEPETIKLESLKIGEKNNGIQINKSRIVISFVIFMLVLFTLFLILLIMRLRR